MPTRETVDRAGFNTRLQLPFQLRLADFELALQDVYDFFFDVNLLFEAKGLPRLDDNLRPAILSGMLSDMLTASRAVLEYLKLKDSKLFLAGWSQGGFVTMALLEKLEHDGVSVQAAATASAPVDISVALNGFLSFPRKNDASWVTTLFILSSFSFENYYGVPGLARSLINDQYYDVARQAYERQPVNPADIPTDLHKLIRAEYFDSRFFAADALFRYSEICRRAAFHSSLVEIWVLR